MKKRKVQLFLDSGAFSAFTQGKVINIQEYITFIKENEDKLAVYANLDVIGDPQATWRNQRIMEAEGLSPMPIFHYGAEMKWLDKYLAKGYDYIALGGMVPISTQMLYPWLDRLFSEKLTDSKGIPIIKVHGFGLTSFPLMLRYPWYSVDSTSWVITGRLGSIYVPRYKNGKSIYSENAWKVAVSVRSPNMKEAGKHINTLRPNERKLVLNYLEEKGYTLGRSSFRTELQTYKPTKQERWAEKKPHDPKKPRLVELVEEPGVGNVYQLRDEVNIQYFLELERSLPAWPWQFKKKGRDGLLL